MIYCIHYLHDLIYQYTHFLILKSHICWFYSLRANESFSNNNFQNFLHDACTTFLKLFRSYLRNRKQHIWTDKNNNTNEKKVTWHVLQGSILPLGFLIYAYDLPSASDSLNTTIFVDNLKYFLNKRTQESYFDSEKKITE